MQARPVVMQPAITTVVTTTATTTIRSNFAGFVYQLLAIDS